MKTYQQIFDENRDFAKQVFTKIDKKLSKVTLRSRDKLPDGVDENGFHINMLDQAKDVPEMKDWWCNGFFGGMNLLMYSQTKNEEYLKTARRSEELLEPGAWDFQWLHHDVGFMWHILSGADYRLTGNEDAKSRNFYMASVLASRFVLGCNYIRAWNAWNGVPGDNHEGWSIVDCMMNIPLLYWASETVDDDRYKRIAMAHADMTIRDHVRPDGSVAHIVIHDRIDGSVIETLGGQGYEVGSSWSRGAAWALYGFTLSYIYTKEQRYLDTAKRVANYFIANVCDDWMPRCDFRSPAEPVFYDSTAAGCAACGLIELAKLLPENEGGIYMNAGVKLVHAIDEHFANYEPENDHLVDFGTVRYPKEYTPEALKAAGVHKSIIYGDFFYVEAILKLLGNDFRPW